MIYSDCKACLGRGRVEGMLGMMGNGRMIPCSDCIRREGYESGARDARASIAFTLRQVAKAYAGTGTGNTYESAANITEEDGEA